MSESIIRPCKSCGVEFAINPDEQQFFAQLAAQAPERAPGGWFYPVRCTTCRARRRAARLATKDDGQSETLICQDCGMSFTFGSRDKTYYAAQGFAPPKRCRPCRRQRQASHGA